MDCLVCNKSLASHINSDCFSLSLNNLKLHYDYIKNILQKRDSELQQIQRHNEHLNKLLQSSQEDQSCKKRVKKDQKFSCDQGESNTDSSVVEDEVGPNLNMALNSEQLFETSVLSPIVNNVSKTSSELVTSPRVSVPSKRKKQENVHSFNAKNQKILERSNSLWQSKEKSKVLPTKSWATKFLQPKGPPTKTSGPEKCKKTSKISDKKLSLSLTKSNVSKVKQTFLDNYNTKLSDSTFCDDIIEASPVIEKSYKSSRSWLLQRSGHGLNHDCNITGKDKENKEKQLPVGEIFFDFSPTKKTDASTLIDLTTSTKDNIKEMPSQRQDSSSVIMLTPATQDIIFVDDISEGNTTSIDTMELLADLKQNATNSFKYLKKYESKSIEKYQNQGERKEPKVHQVDKKHIKFPKPGSFVKLEKITQIEKEDDGRSKENVTQLSNNSSDQEEEEDVMPKPIKVKQEINEEPGKKINIKEKFNIDCEECENFINFFGDHLSVEDIETHIKQCVVHNREKLNKTPENFWHPHILSFPQDDPRRKILIDTRLRDKNC